ncbi:MAG TPA: cytochrome c maturation protein CcmE [Polyangia bacterium]
MLGAVAGALLWSAVRPPVRYFKHVDEAIADREMIRAGRHDLQVHGFLVPGSIIQRAERERGTFAIASGPGRSPAVLGVRCQGLISDAFRVPEACDAPVSPELERFCRIEMIARGTLAADGWLDVTSEDIRVKRWRD